MGNHFCCKRDPQPAVPPAVCVLIDPTGDFSIGFNKYVPCEFHTQGRRCRSDFALQSNTFQFIEDRRDDKFVVCPGHREQARLNGYMPM